MAGRLAGRKILVTGAASGMGEARDVARAALFFSSDASGLTTGTEFPVDIGFSWR